MIDFDYYSACLDYAKRHSLNLKSVKLPCNMGNPIVRIAYSSRQLPKIQYDDDYGFYKVWFNSNLYLVKKQLMEEIITKGCTVFEDVFSAWAKA